MTGQRRASGVGFPGYSDDAPLDLGDLGAAARQGLVDRLVGGTFHAWADAAARVGHCAHPIKLVGSSSRVDRATGEVADVADLLVRHQRDDGALGTGAGALLARRAHQGDVGALPGREAVGVIEGRGSS